MFDIGWQEIFIIAVVVIIIVGPKDLPRVLRTVGLWTGKARSMVREFQGHLDDMVRESELEDFKKEIQKAADEPLGQAYEHIVGDDGAMADAFEFGGEEFDSIESDTEKKKNEDAGDEPEAVPEPETPVKAVAKD
jgi:sec-independent protein translocase protein TatB